MGEVTNDKNKYENRRSWVRISATYAAIFFIFIFGMVIVGYELWHDKYEEAKETFQTVLPIASGIVSYWFAARSNSRNKTDSSGG